MVASLLVEIKLKEKDGTQSISCMINFSEICTVPIWVTATPFPLRSVTKWETCATTLVNKEMPQII